MWRAGQARRAGAVIFLFKRWNFISITEDGLRSKRVEEAADYMKRLLVAIGAAV
jgi:hypothetical protein